MKLTVLIFAILLQAACSHTGARHPASAAIYETSFIAEHGAYPSVHGATLAEIPSTRQILGCWYAGEREMGRDVQIYCSHLDASTKKWTSPIVAVQAQERHTGDILASKSIGNPVLFHDPETQLTYLFFGTVTVGGWRGVRTFYRVSKDLGLTWSASIMVEGSFPGDSLMLGRMGKFVRIKPVLISKNQFLLPMYSEWDEKRSFSCLFEKINGLFKEKSCQLMPGQESLQPSFAFFQNSLRSYTRSKNGFVQTSRLDLQSFKWSQLENLSVPNPDSSVDTVTSFTGNELLFVGNTIKSGRNKMNLLISSDGKTFREIFSFDHSEDPLAEYSYPALIKSSDGFYYLAYTHHRKGIKSIRFNEAWLQEKQSPTSLHSQALPLASPQEHRPPSTARK